jgi:hypothetical protein
MKGETAAASSATAKGEMRGCAALARVTEPDADALKFGLAKEICFWDGGAVYACKRKN